MSKNIRIFGAKVLRCGAHLDIINHTKSAVASVLFNFGMFWQGSFAFLGNNGRSATKNRKLHKSLCLHIANYVIQYIVQGWFVYAKGKTVPTKKDFFMKKAKGYQKAIEFAIIFMFFGIVAILASVLVLPSMIDQGDTKMSVVQSYCLYIGIAIVAVSVLIIICAISSHSKAKRKLKAQQPAVQTEPEAIADAEVSMDAPTTTVTGTTVTYVPSTEVANFVEMGSYQSIEEKFDQIAKMDKTQFVIYIARLFSRKGYQVKLTPVFDNYGIDMLVEKMGVIIAVQCLLTNRVLCENDVKTVVDGKTYYPASQAMVLTNMYFDRTAVDFAKANRISLVDRVILTEDFMD